MVRNLHLNHILLFFLGCRLSYSHITFMWQATSVSYMIIDDMRLREGLVKIFQGLKPAEVSKQ